MGFTLVTPPACEPITLADAVNYLKGESQEWPASENALVSSLITAARRNVEQRLSMAVIEQEWKYTLDTFPLAGFPIILPRPPIRRVRSIKYLDDSSTEVTLASSGYVVNLTSGQIGLADGGAWPTIANAVGAVRIRYLAGFTDDASCVPADLRAAMLLLVGDMYRNREAQVAGSLTDNKTVCALLDPYYRFWDTP